MSKTERGRGRAGRRETHMDIARRQDIQRARCMRRNGGRAGQKGARSRRHMADACHSIVDTSHGRAQYVVVIKNPASTTSCLCRSVHLPRAPARMLPGLPTLPVCLHLVCLRFNCGRPSCVLRALPMRMTKRARARAVHRRPCSVHVRSGSNRKASHAAVFSRLFELVGRVHVGNNHRNVCVLCTSNCSGSISSPGSGACSSREGKRTRRCLVWAYNQP